MASRYNSFDSRSSTASSRFSDPSSSAEALTFSRPSSTPPPPSSRALVKSKPSKPKTNDHNLTAMVKKFMEKKSTSSSSSAPPGLSSKKVPGLVSPPDLIAQDLKKTARRGATLMGLQKKLFGKENKKEVKALTEAKGSNVNNSNTRSLAMVLRSERELLNANKDQDLEIAQLKLTLQEKNREVEKLKDLCLKQREEIRSLKDAVLFPDVMDSQLQNVLEKQGSELKQAKQLIPGLQRQVASLTGQLQWLADDLAEVKADKYGRARNGSSQRTPSYEEEESANSLDLSSCDEASPDSPDDLLLKDLNPCLTPYCIKKNSKEYDSIGYNNSSLDESLHENNTQMSNELSFNSRIAKLSKSSDRRGSPNSGRTVTRAARRSEDNKGTYGKMPYKK